MTRINTYLESSRDNSEATETTAPTKKVERANYVAEPCTRCCGVVLKYIYRVKGVLRWVPSYFHYFTDLLTHYSMQKRGGQERASWVPPTRSVMPTPQYSLRHFYGSMFPHFYISKFARIYIITLH